LVKQIFFISGGQEAAIYNASVGGSQNEALLQIMNLRETASIHFCTSRDGFVMGEGSGALSRSVHEHAKLEVANYHL